MQIESYEDIASVTEVGVSSLQEEVCSCRNKRMNLYTYRMCYFCYLVTFFVTLAATIAEQCMTEFRGAGKYLEVHKQNEI